MTDYLINISISTCILFGAALVFIAPLRKRERWLVWLLPIFALFLVVMGINFQAEGIWWLVSQLIQYLSIALMVFLCTKISVAGDLYCAIWILVCGETVHELWLCFRLFFREVDTSLWMDIVSLLLFSAIFFFFISRTIARWMPQGDIYQIGPRQLISAILLGGLCISMSHYFLVPRERDVGIAIIFLICQAYCISLLYLQTELFKKSQMEKDLEAMNFLYSCEQQQYAAAVQNVNMVSQKCQELEQMIDQMQQYLPEDLRREPQGQLQDAMRACDLMLRTGNAVLDIVLTEKSMLAQMYGIQINCVADGKLLNFMEVVDIYAVFSNALDNAIEAVRLLQDENHRLIDVLIHESQNFLVINISNPLISPLQFEEDLPVTTKSRNSFHGYGLKVLRRTIEKYHGIFSIETSGKMFTLKVLIPLAQKQK